MQFIKVKFLKNGQPQGRGYTYRSEEELLPGDKVDLGSGKSGIVVDEPVDADWIKTYGADKVAVAKKHAEPETFDTPRANEAQKKYCAEKRYPHFAPISICHKCNQDIYAKDGKGRDGNPRKGISVERAGKELITGCPFCNWSYCE